MAEDRRLEGWFLWALAAGLAIIAILHWVAYFVGPGTWVSSWAAIPLTGAAIAAAIGAFALGRRKDKVRLIQR